MTFSYQTTTPDGSSLAALVTWLVKEFNAIKQAFGRPVPYVRFVPMAMEPEKRQFGDVYLADGTNWNPGSGEGLYFYTSAGTWSFIG